MWIDSLPQEIRGNFSRAMSIILWGMAEVQVYPAWTPFLAWAVLATPPSHAAFLVSSM